MKRYKVLHLPTTVGGNSQGMSSAMREIGLDSTSLTLSQNYFQYPADQVLWNVSDGIIRRNFKRFRLMFLGYQKYDVIHFNFGVTLSPVCVKPVWRGLNCLPYWLLKYSYSKYCDALFRVELFYLSILKKPVFMTYQGDDARQGDYCLSHFKISIASQVDNNYYYLESDRYKRKRIKLFYEHCKQIYAVNPDLLHVLPEGARFIPYSHISLKEWVPNYTQLEDRPIRIVHAPSHRRVKGTDLIAAALDELKREGLIFEFLLVEGLSNADAKKIYESADILIDQLFAGWYGGLSVELMALGKPVVVYIRDGDLKFIPEEMRLDMPFIQITPDTVKEVLSQTLLMPRDELFQLAKKSRAYVERWHDPVKIAEMIKLDYMTALGDRVCTG